MGAWGIKARESDYGLDLLALIEREHLQKNGFKHFNLTVALKLLKEHIIDSIKYANRGCPADEMDFWIEANFSGFYESAVLLVAECLVDYLQNGCLVIDVFKPGEDEPTQKMVNDFIFNQGDLLHLSSELETILSPESEVFNSWMPEYFDEWFAYAKMLHETIKSQMP